MSRLINISAAALRDMEEIVDYYIREANLNVALEISDGLEATIDQLKEMPNRGHIVPELERINVQWYKEIHFKIYRIIYEIDDASVFVHAVLDGRRNIQEILHRRMLR